ncbi:MAG: hypothetical protein QXX08_03150 [Candidatus Bathyarchaeia archaeon]
MRCPECGSILEKTDDNPESYECICGYAIRRLTTEKSKLFVTVTVSKYFQSFFFQ